MIRFCPLLLLFFSSSAFADLSITAYPDTVRFDLSNGQLLLSKRQGGPASPEPFVLGIRPLKFRALQDEVVAFQLVLTGQPGPRKIAVKGSAQVRASVFVERGIEVKSASNNANTFSLGPGTYPDILVQTATVTLPKTPQIAVLWVDLWVQPQATGLQKLSLSIGKRVLDIEVEVLDIAMPQKDVARLGTVNFGSFLKRDAKSMMRWMQLAHAHYLSIEIMRPKPKVRDDGSIDWESWATQVGPYVDGSAFTEPMGYQGPRTGQPLARHFIPLTDRWPFKAKNYLPSNPARWSTLLGEWERFVKEKGWFTVQNPTTWVLFVNSLDEPKEPEKLEAMMAYDKLIADAKLEDRKRVFFRVDGNFGQKIEGWDDARMAKELDRVVDMWNLHGAPWTIPWPLVKKLKDGGDRVMFYASNTSGEPGVPPLVIDSPITGARAWAWIIYRYQLEGAVNWEVDFCENSISNPLCSPGGRMNMDANLIYRSHEIDPALGHDLPVASMRIKALRRGAQDAALLALLGESDPVTAEKLAQIIVPRALGDRVPQSGYGAWPHEPMSYVRARQAILDRLGRGVKTPLSLSDVREERPPLFEGRLKDVALRAAVAIGVLVIWLVFRKRA